MLIVQRLRLLLFLRGVSVSVEDRFENLLFALEMAVDIGVAHFGPCGDLGDGESMHPLFADDLQRGLDDFFPAYVGVFLGGHNNSFM